ncbi:MAG: flagellar hook-length control protein FliK [Pelosinus sp.]|nr:flagellar hook-length control protein FliK [Pelosinus sp.]
MDIMNAVVPMPSAGATGNQARVPQGAETGKNGKNTDVFTSMLSTAAQQKAVGEEPKDLQGNIAAMDNLAAILATAGIKGLTTADSGETQKVDVVNKDAKLPEVSTDTTVNAQMLAAVMALLGAQTPGAAQNTAAGSPNDITDLGKTSASNIEPLVKVKASQIPFAVLQGKVLSALQSMATTQAVQNTAGADQANNLLQESAEVQLGQAQNILPGASAVQGQAQNVLPGANVVVQGQAQNILPSVNAVQEQAQNILLAVNAKGQIQQNMAPDMGAANVQAFSQMAGLQASSQGQSGKGQNADKTDGNTKAAETKKINQDAASVLSAKPQTTEHIVIQETEKPNLVQAIAAKTSEAAGNSVGEMLQSNTQKEQENVSDKDAQPVVFGNILAQHTDKAAVHTIQPQAMPSAQDPHNIADQIVEQAKLFKQPFDPNSSEMLIKLRPEHLGELTLKVAVDNGVVSASFHTNNAEVRSAIEASLPQLKQELSNQGLKVDNVDVYAGMSDFFSGSQQGELFRQQQQQQQQSAKFKNLNVTEDFVQAVEEKALPQVAGADGVDYRV